LSDHPKPSRLDSVSAASIAKDADPLPAAKPVAQPKPDQNAATPATAAPDREVILDLARKGLLDSASAACKAALARSPEDPFLLLMMGKLSTDGKQSADYFKKAVKYGGTSPEAGESLFRLGQFNYAAGHYHTAIPFFRDYLRLFPKGDWKEPAHYWMGNACLSLAQGRPDKAAYLDSGTAWFQKLLEASKPEDYYYPLALEGLAKAKAAKGDRDGARKAAQSALEKAPEEEQSPLLLLSAQLCQGVDRDEEKSLMARLIGRYPQSPEARYLRKLNANADTSKWKSGAGLPRPAIPPALDTLAPVAAPATAASPSLPSAKPATGAKAQDSARKAAVPSTLPNGKPAEAKPYTLQLGAFSQAANAQAMMEGLTKAGFSPELVESARGGKKLYQVRLGRFATSEEASEYGRTVLKPKQFLSQPVLVSP
jgi:tetratricopeptide (TPR) repeat protein